MLVLTRKKNQSIMINDNIEIIVVDIKGDQIKLGIKAPRSVSIYRSEVYEEIQKENLIAAKADKNSLKGIGDILKGFKLPKKDD